MVAITVAVGATGRSSSVASQRSAPSSGVMASSMGVIARMGEVVSTVCASLSATIDCRRGSERWRRVGSGG